MNLQSLLAGLVHGLGLVSLSAAIGGLVLELLVVPAELAILRARLQRWITVCLAVLTLTTIGELVIRTQTMSRAPLAVAIIALPERRQAHPFWGDFHCALRGPSFGCVAFTCAIRRAPGFLLAYHRRNRAHHQPNRACGRLGRPDFQHRH